MIQQKEQPSDIEKDVEKVSEGFQTSWDKMWDRIFNWKEQLIEHLPEVILSILVFTLCYVISIYVKRWIKKPLSRIIKRASIRALVANIVSGFIVLIGLLISVSLLNLSDLLTGIMAAGGIAGLAVALAFQGTLANTFSGIFLSLNDVMNVGDWVVTNGFEGNIEEITLRNTRIREADNNIAVIPNKNIIESPFKNYGLTPRIRTSIKCGVHYDSDLRFVKKIAIEAISKRFPHLDYEHVEFHWLEFADSSINFQIRFWIEARSNLTILEAKSEAIMIIKETFDHQGINIPFPIRTLEWAKKPNDSEEN
ncbi:MAG: mechanosensitive ion channel family protein [Weeksellaceae bacterium]